MCHLGSINWEGSAENEIICGHLKLQEVKLTSLIIFLCCLQPFLVRPFGLWWNPKLDSVFLLIKHGLHPCRSWSGSFLQEVSLQVVIPFIDVLSAVPGTVPMLLAVFWEQILPYWLQLSGFFPPKMLIVHGKLLLTQSLTQAVLDFENYVQ